MVFLHHIVDHGWTLYCSPGPAQSSLPSGTPPSWKPSGLRPRASPLRTASPDVFARWLQLFARLHQMSSTTGFSSSPGFARCLRLPASALHQASPSKPEGWVGGDLHSDSDGPWAFGRWPKVATPTGGHLAGSKGAFVEAGAPTVGPHYRFVGRRCGAAC